ncbi:hypothetical protein VUR80DRAFT_1358 [Thermomyces stellatus]
MDVLCGGWRTSRDSFPSQGRPLWLDTRSEHSSQVRTIRPGIVTSFLKTSKALPKTVAPRLAHATVHRLPGINYQQ